MKLHVKIQHCHGISDMEYEFELNDKPVVIHAANGTFKTSFCKAVEEYNLGLQSKDVILNVAGSSLFELNGQCVPQGRLHVFRDFNDYGLADNSKGLLVNPALVSLAESAKNAFENSKAVLYEAIKRESGIKKDADFAENVIRALCVRSMEDIHKVPLRAKSSRLPPIKDYSACFSSDIRRNLSNNDYSSVLKSYVRSFQKCAKRVRFIKDGCFDLANLFKVSETLKMEHYFDAGNKIHLLGIGKEISDSAELDDAVSRAKKVIASTPEVQEKLVELQDVFKNKRGMAKVLKNIETDSIYASLYADYSKFEKEYFTDILLRQKPLVDDVRQAEKKYKSTMRSILLAAQKSKTLWQEIVDSFMKRFSPPYILEVVDRDFAVLGMKEVVLKFSYDVSGSKYEVEQGVLSNDVLSAGERRVLHLLNAMMKIEALKSLPGKHILVFDDVADMFDYSNKHGIIEYLSELAACPNLYIIVLTHNFDFYRHFGFKVAGRQNSYFATKDSAGKICISQAGYLRNVYLDHLKVKAKNNDVQGLRCALAMLPFARASIENTCDNYSGEKSWSFYTDLLHYRPSTGAHYFGTTLFRQYKALMQIEAAQLKNCKEQVYKILFKEAWRIANEVSVGQCIEDKMVLSIAMRIYGEKYMMHKVKGQLSLPQDKEYGVVLSHFEQHNPSDRALPTLKTIALFAPSEIHLNGFAYECLVDYSIIRMRNLFKELYALLPASFKR